MIDLQLSMPPLAAGTSCATVKPNAKRPVTGFPFVGASATVKTMVGVIGAVAGMLTDVMVAKLRARGAAAATALCMAMESASCPPPWQSEQVSIVSAAGGFGVPPSAPGPCGPAGPSCPAGPCGPG